ncbi:DUF2321 domain-containing protein [Staphylococcus hominis]|uniref:DUF2321 domain-containing protein n=1 Tax=Staphylococcus hominis TaxID=1290 RepID=UPI00131F04BE|nr:DUF2321 domain-containing protein [Staphylococcus hominis]MCC3736399.1 DUF2321 domain-containing protein [Staphylococcus hominis]
MNIKYFYKDATICLNGHVVSKNEANYSKFCKVCGKETISNCQHCKTPIQGVIFIPNSMPVSKYNRPNYCHSCGKAYPWTEQVINNAVELVSLDDQLSDEYKEIIKSALPDLVVDSPDTPLAQAKYKKYMSNATNYIQDSVRNLLIDVVSETVKKSIF